MENFVALIITAAFLSVAGIMVMRNVRSGAHVSGKSRAAPAVLLVGALMSLCDMAAGKGLLLRLPLDILLPSLAAFLLNSAMIPLRGGRVAAVAVCMTGICGAGYYLLCAIAGLQLPPGISAVAAALTVAVLIAGVFLYGIFCKVRAISALLASGNAWDMLNFGTEAVYAVFYLVETICMIAAFGILGTESYAMAIFPVLFGAGLLALAFRLFSGSSFVLARRHESRIAGALKVTDEIYWTKRSSANETYREIYSRIVVYFEEEKPYLNGDLTINDVVKVVYTNKLYISRAISQCAGKNFCQFVNYYRVMYSIESYRLNPEMRVADLWQGSGFNSIVSYNMAFKLFMGENPSDWCRKERARLAKCKK